MIVLQPKVSQLNKLNHLRILLTLHFFMKKGFSLKKNRIVGYYIAKTLPVQVILEEAIII